MLKKVLPLVVFVLVAIGVFIFAENQFVPSFRTCLSQAAVQQTAERAKHQRQVITVGVESQAVCSLRLVDKHNGFFAALASLVIAVFSFTLWRSTDRQGDLTRDAMIAGERAFVFPTGFQHYFDPPADPHNPVYIWRFRPFWKNSGDTPTKDMTIATAVLVRDAQLPPKFNFDSVLTNLGKNTLLPPQSSIQGGQAPQTPDPGVTVQDLLDAKDGKKVIYIMGLARYFDVFPDTPERITRFCWVMVPKGDFMSDKISFDYISHSEGNCADDECRAQGIG